jgi:Ni/Co efflux regulator RcnB
MLRILSAFVLAVACATTLAQQQPPRKQEGRQMSQEDRERMRQDMREAYRQRQERPGGQQQQKMRQMSPEERGKLRRDIEAANKDLRR